MARNGENKGSVMMFNVAGNMTWKWWYITASR